MLAGASADTGYSADCSYVLKMSFSLSISFMVILFSCYFILLSSVNTGIKKLVKRDPTKSPPTVSIIGSIVEEKTALNLFVSSPKWLESSVNISGNAPITSPTLNI